MADMGYAAYRDRQLDYESIDDGGFEDRLNESLPSLSLTPYEMHRQYEDNPFQPAIELILARILRAAFSPRQLYERVVHFWTDHFSIDILANHAYHLKPVDDRDVIRAHALGNFLDLVSASAHSPAMLEYLTNDSNVKGHPNENYARELMELHTMGVDGGYTQEDVREVARAFTGWTLYNLYDARPEMGQFLYDDSVHDQDEKVVLGRTIAGGGGISDGERVLEILSSHPKTSEFIAYKMARFFWGYNPSRGLVRKAARKYQATDGDLRSVLKVILAKNKMKKAKPKLKRPFHLMISAMRGTLADARELRFLFERLEIAGNLPFAWTAPNGYPDDPDYWSGFVLPRWNFAADFPDAAQSQIQIDPAFLDESKSPKQIVKLLDQRLFNRTMPSSTKTAIRDFLAAEPVSKKRLREAVTIALASPEFQLY